MTPGQQTDCACFFAAFCPAERQRTASEPRACEHFRRLVRLWRLVRSLTREARRD